MKKILLFLTSLFIGAALFVLIGGVIGWQEIKDAFLVFTGWEGIIILILSLLIIMIGNWRWKEILRGQGVETSFFKLFRIHLAGFSIIFLAPTLIFAGEIFRSYTLRKEKGVSWPKVIASVFIDRFLEWTMNLIFIFLGLSFFLYNLTGYEIGLIPRNLIIISTGIFLLISAFVSFFYLKALRRESIAQLFFKVTSLKNSGSTTSVLAAEQEVFDFLKMKKSALKKALGLSFLASAVLLFRAWLLILFLGKNIAILPALSVLGFSYLAMTIPIPASLGSHEALQVIAFNSFGLGSSAATAFTVIIRGAEFLVALAGVIILLKLGVRFLNGFFFNNLNRLTNKTNR